MQGQKTKCPKYQDHLQPNAMKAQPSQTFTISIGPNTQVALLQTNDTCIRKIQLKPVKQEKM